MCRLRRGHSAGRLLRPRGRRCLVSALPHGSNASPTGRGQPRGEMLVLRPDTQKCRHRAPARCGGVLASASRSICSHAPPGSGAGTDDRQIRHRQAASVARPARPTRDRTSEWRSSWCSISTSRHGRACPFRPCHAPNDKATAQLTPFRRLLAASRIGRISSTVNCSTGSAAPEATVHGSLLPRSMELLGVCRDESIWTYAITKASATWCRCSAWQGCGVGATAAVIHVGIVTLTATSGHARRWILRRCGMPRGPRRECRSRRRGQAWR